MQGFPDLTDNLLVLLYGWLLPFLSGVRAKEALAGVRMTEALRRRFYLANSLFLLLSACPIALSWAWHERPFETLGFIRGLAADSPSPWIWALTALLVALYLADLGWNIRATRRDPSMAAELEEKVPFLPRRHADMPAYLFMCASAAVSEELVYRGFMVAYFLPAYNGREGIPYLAATVPALLFSLAHLYQGWQAVAKILLLSILLACIYMLSGSLWLVIGIHFAIDAVSGWSSWMLMKRLDAEREKPDLEQGSSGFEA